MVRKFKICRFNR